MTTAAQFLAACRDELGYTEQPAGSNMTKYAQIAGHPDGFPWCCTFLVAVAGQTGLPLPDGVGESAYTWTQLGAWRRAGQASPHPQVGAWAYFEIGAGHVGVVEAFDDTTVTTIDGNTIPDGKTGDQANGGEVCRKTRPRALVAGYGLPAYHFASGVRNFSGGFAWVGEQGPELVRLPQGSDTTASTPSEDDMPSICFVPWADSSIPGREPFFELRRGDYPSAAALVVSHNDAHFTPPFDRTVEGDVVLPEGLWARRYHNANPEAVPLALGIADVGRLVELAWSDSATFTVAVRP